MASKILGVIFLLTSSFLLFRWMNLKSKNRVRNKRVRFNVNDIFWLEENIAFYRKLSKEDKKIFENRLGLFLADVIVTEVDKEIPEKATCLYVGSSAIIAFWGLPYWNYGDLNEVLVYPENFDLDKTLNKKGVVAGMVHHGGLLNNTMILSLPALIHGFRNLTDGRNVGVHEFAHLIDKANGEINGIPVGIDDKTRAVWLEVYKSELSNPNFILDDYAKTNTQEFFAVSVEMYKENPERLKKQDSELFKILDDYFSSKKQ